jgi:hypothetical protein
MALTFARTFTLGDWGAIGGPMNLLPGPLLDPRPENSPALAIGLGAVRWIAVAIVAGLVAGCSDPAPAYYQAFGFQCATRHSATAATMCNKSTDPGNAKVSRFCYKSLADTNCFDRPDPDQKNQPQGSPG